VAVIGLMTSATVLMACSHDATTSSSGSGSSSSGSSPAATGGGNEVKVEGQDLAGLDPSTVNCVKQAGKINITSGAAGGQQGLVVVMTDEATPKVESLALVVDGNALAVSDNMGMKVGSADVAVSGSTYNITGSAQGADMKNPMAGMITKQFAIKVTCS
jgi:lipoprotein LpqH